ncbi:DDE-type integrase/transposase/recombinase [Paraburkholderia sp. Ac-20336]|uniref:Mu transposase C-terminal domain-containing protein n=1 Tax=Paraburkholderia sp. Ac-20336 TaxID=2703886 RepID=UPI00198094C0|nr:Mu transposase C-terminal domain-containing protein [Paraburkholderia sp. Ac-20336]MBN3804153.1 DDE-type integrase/transposase/recombinase [Paraburkholderia sp. Ac-20336]
MLTDIELHELFERLGTQEAHRRKIQWIRTNAPVRAVDGGRRSHRVRYASHKMGFVIECEAKITEYSAAVTWDFDDETLEFYGQPAFLQLTAQLPNGRRSSWTYTPDFFRITRSGFEFVECKTGKELSGLVQKRPHAYSIDDRGDWRYPPAEEHVNSDYGASFRIRPASENNLVLIENLEYLRDYILKPAQSDPVQQARLRDYLAARRWATVSDILSDNPDIADTLNADVVEGRINFDLTAQRITDREHALVFRDASCASAYRVFAASQTNNPRDHVILSLMPGTGFGWDGKRWEVINRGDTEIACRCVDPDVINDNSVIVLQHGVFDALARKGQIVPIERTQDDDAQKNALNILQQASDAQLKVAYARYSILFSPNISASARQYSRRARQYWLASYRNAERTTGYGFLGLVPNWQHTQGNHERKIHTDVLGIIANVFHTGWVDPRQKTNSALFGKVIVLCEEKGLRAPSRNTFVREIQRLTTRSSVMKRFGGRVAYEMAPIPTIPDGHLTYATPRHGTHPFHIGHIDHTPLPMRLRSMDGKTIRQSAWLTLLLDAYSRKVLAFYVTFDSPSYRSNMMLIRDCVKRHGRVPQFIVVDKGKDFQSIYFDQLLAALRCHKLDRRTSQPRDGSVIEIIFNVSQNDFIYNLRGNTQADREYRKKTKSVDPVALSVWTLHELISRLGQYFDQVYQRNHHSTLGCSPDEIFAHGLALSGTRSHARIPYSKAFILLSLPSTNKGTARVTTHGVKINYVYYSCVALRLHSALGQVVPVRYDPYNMGIAYAYINHRWHECQSECYLVFKDHSEREMQIASEYLRAKHRMAGHHYPVNAKRLANFLTTTEADEVLGLQRLRQRELADDLAERNNVIEPESAGASTWEEGLDASDTEFDTYAPQLLGDL